MSTFSTYDSTVNSFYLAFYGRPAEPAGLKFWSQQLADNNGDLGAITQAFAISEEAQVRFGADSVNDRIAEIYQQLFNHTPDAAGLAYWTGVIEQGHASMADVAVAILKGAKDSDASLSQLRQQAADAFTAQVEAGGTQYDGYASIEAARILVRAVTADATAADLDVLVKAAVSFADTATKTPQVVEAISVNTTLLALFDTARGTKEPVALAKALADTAKAAAGDPVTLESLLRGGGMDKVLKVMPAKATLKDVVDALGTGGLPAAVEVVYPTAPVGTPKPIPVPVPEKTFYIGGLEHDLKISGTATDDVVVDLTTNTILRAGHTPAYSMNDVTTVFAKDYAGKVTVTGTLAEIEVALQDAEVSGVHGYGVIDVKSGLFSGAPGERQFVSQDIDIILDRAHLVKLTGTLSMEERALFDKLKDFNLDKLVVLVDNEAPGMPAIALAEDNGASPNDGITSVAKLAITGLDTDSDTVWQYSTDKGATWQEGGKNDGSGKAELDLSKMQAEGTTLQVRQLDAAGNAGEASQPVTFTIVPDLEGPSLPPLPATFFVHPLGPTAIISGSATDAVLVDLEANTVTRAGHDPVSHPVAIGMINSVDYAGEVTVVGSAAALSPMAGNFKATGVDAYRIVDIKSHIFTGEPGARAFALDIAQLVDGAASVKVIDVLSVEEQKLFDDLGGFDMTTLDAKVDQTIPSMPNVVLDIDSGNRTSSANDKLTNVGTYSIKDQEVGTTLQFSLNGETGWGRDKPVAKEGDNTIYVRQVDKAGNAGESTKFEFTLDTLKPGYLDLMADNKTGVVEIKGAEENGVYIEYRTSTDGQWQAVNARNDKGNPVVTLTGEGDMYIEVRQTDQAGNEGDFASLSFPMEPIAPGLPFKVIATADGVRIDSTIDGTLRLSGAGSASVKTLDPSGKVVVGETDVGAQPGILSGTFTLAPKGAMPLRDDSGIVYTLGSTADDVIENADYAWGFDGVDQMIGTAGNNRLYGGAGDDVLNGMEGDDYLDGGAGNDLLFGGAGRNTMVGGPGGDYIISMGDDTVVFGSAAESNAGNLHDKSSQVRTYDMINAMATQKLTLDFEVAISNVKITNMPAFQADSAEAMFALLTQAYKDSGASGSDLAVFNTGRDSVLVVDNGDGNIDVNDVAVAVIGGGGGSFTLDFNGNVTYFNLPS